MRLPKVKQEEQKMLDNLSVPQLEQAMKWLAQPIKESPPQELEKLNEMEWFLLSRMLQSLMSEKLDSPLQ